MVFTCLWLIIVKITHVCDVAVTAVHCIGTSEASDFREICNEVAGPEHFFYSRLFTSLLCIALRRHTRGIDESLEVQYKSSSWWVSSWTHRLSSLGCFLLSYELPQNHCFWQYNISSGSYNCIQWMLYLNVVSADMLVLLCNFIVLQKNI